MDYQWIGTILGKDLTIKSYYYGLISGPIFYIPLICSSLAAGYVSENFSRKYAAFGSVFLWSVMIITYSFAQTVVHAMILSASIGMFMGFFVPPAISLIVDYFPASR